MSQADTEIVLVEDNPNDAALIARVLRKACPNTRLVVLKDGVEALEFFLGEGGGTDKATAHPKVILLDLKLPKVSGTEVLRRIKADDRTRTIPVVILTSSSEPRDLSESYGFGANSYVTKPVNFNDFSRVVAELGVYWLNFNMLPDGSREAR